MMGARTLYLDGAILAILAILDEGELRRKADGASDAIEDAAGCPRFTVAMGPGWPQAATPSSAG
jgi:hypothetical protein